MCALLWRWIYATYLSPSVSFLWQRHVSLLLCSLVSVHVHSVSHFPVINLLILSPDIPLLSLEERKSEHFLLLQERISQLKQQMAGDCRPPGNMSTCCLKINSYPEPLVHIQVCIFTVHCVVSYCRATSGQLVTDCIGVARWPLFQNNYGQPEQLACFREIKIHNIILADVLDIHSVELSLSMG